VSPSILNTVAVGLMVVGGLGAALALWLMAPDLAEGAGRLQRKAGTRYAAFAERVDRAVWWVQFQIALMYVKHLTNPVPVPYSGLAVIDAATGRHPVVTEIGPGPAPDDFLPAPPPNSGSKGDEEDTPEVEVPEQASVGQWPVPVLESAPPAVPVDALLFHTLGQYPVLDEDAIRSDVTAAFRKLTPEYLAEMDATAKAA